MKKLISCLLLICLVSFSFAEIYPHSRILELSFGANVGFANSYFSISDFLKEEIFIDLNDMDNVLDPNGLNFDLDANGIMGASIYFGKKGFLKMDMNIEASSRFTLPHSIIDFLANGNQLDKPIQGSLDGGLDVFMDVGAEVGTKIKRFKVGVSGRMFLPILHVDNTKLAFSAVANSDGTNVLGYELTSDIYYPSVVDILENGDPLASVIGNDHLQMLSQLNNYAGFDFGVTVEYPLFKFLDVGVYVDHIPLVPAKMYSKVSMSTSGEYEVAVKDLLAGDSEESTEESDSNTTTETETPLINSTYEKLDDPYKLYRKFEFGATAAYRPLGDHFLTLRPTIGFAFDNPAAVTIESFKNTIENFGFTFGVNAELELIRIIRLALNSKYDSGLWTQNASLAFNLHVLEIMFELGSQGTDFVGSFTGNGLDFGVGFKIGF